MSGAARPAAPAGDARRHLLLAVDGSEGSRRAVMYVADFFGGYRDLYVTLLSIVPQPPEDLFRTDAERDASLRGQSAEREALLGEYRRLLAAGGLRADRISTRLRVRRCASLADAILEEQEELRCCIVVVGRRGLSHHEEFLFGSTSNRILHRARHCAVLIVE